MLNNIRIGTRLFAMSGILGVIMLVLGWLALGALTRSTEQLEHSLATAVSVTEVVDHARETQGQLVKQWKEWKDLLIRGHKKEDFDKYIGSFHRQDSIVRAGLTAVRDTLKVRDPGERRQPAVGGA